jgi:hypothetical protein
MDNMNTMNTMNATIIPPAIPSYDDNAAEEVSRYGEQTIDTIASPHNVVLNKTTVTGDVSSEKNIHMVQSSAASVNAENNISLENTTCRDEVYAAGDIYADTITAPSLLAARKIDIQKSSISQSLKAEESIDAEGCDTLGAIEAKGFVKISNCPHVDSIETSGPITLIKSEVKKDVSTKGSVTIQDATIGGTLTCASNHLVIERSTIDTIKLLCPPRPMVPQDFSSARIQSLSMQSEMTEDQEHQLVIRLHPVITMTDGSTVVPNMSSHDSAFDLTIPSAEKKTATATAEKKEDKQTLELKNCKVKNIIFETEGGEVILTEGSTEPTSITKGSVRK